MDIYKQENIGTLIEGNSYVGRGIVIGKTEDGKKAATAYFIMGRMHLYRKKTARLSEFLFLWAILFIMTA